MKPKRRQILVAESRRMAMVAKEHWKDLANHTIMLTRDKIVGYSHADLVVINYSRLAEDVQQVVSAYNNIPDCTVACRTT